MNNSISHGNSPSPSDRNISKLTVTPKAVLPGSFPFMLTDEFKEKFSGKGHLQLPSSFKLPHWKRNICEPAYEAEITRVKQLNDAAFEEYTREVARVTTENKRRLAANERAKQDYDEAFAQYKNDMEQYERSLSRRLKWERGAAKAAKKKIIQAKVADLEKSVRGQHAALREAVNLVRKKVESEGWLTQNKWLIRTALLVGFFAFSTAIVTSVCACLAYVWYMSEEGQARERFAKLLNEYNFWSNDNGKLANSPKFLLRDDTRATESVNAVVSPVQLSESLGKSNGKRDPRERNPLGVHTVEGFNGPETLGSVVASCLKFGAMAIPGFGLALMTVFHTFKFNNLKSVADGLDLSRMLSQRETKLKAQLMLELERPTVINALVEEELQPRRRPAVAAPVAPTEIIPVPLLCLPSSPTLHSAEKLTPPDWCYDTPGRTDDFSHQLKGARVYSSEHVRTMASYKVFANNCIRPYFMFGGVPILLSDRAAHTLIAGTAGSGKSTSILRFASAFLPLTRSQAESIEARAAVVGRRYPASADEWTRSHTHQAVVYNGKGEYLNYLKALGFDQDVDLLNFDPSDPKCYAWDVSEDIREPDSITQFAEHLIPRSTSSKQHDGYEMWLSNARGAVEAAIVSLRNAAKRAGKEVKWNLRDLVNAFATKETLRSVLQHHDTPQERIGRYFDLASAQQSSIFVTLWEAIDRFTIIANRWHDAEMNGRCISLKRWALEGRGTVILLPNTMVNVQRYGPLNATLLKALTNIVLSHEYSSYRDKKGNSQSLKREFLFDEIGQAGRLEGLERLMSEGRSFGVNVTIGLHQLSQLRETYGEQLAETILGLCSNRLFLRTDDTTTAEWMSKYLGNCLRSYDKQTFTYGSTQGKNFVVSQQSTSGQSESENRSATIGETQGTSTTNTTSSQSSETKQSSYATTIGKKPTVTHGSSEANGSTTSHADTETESTTRSATFGTGKQRHQSSTSGTSEGVNTSENSSKSNSSELRGEAAIEPHEFMSFPHPQSAGVCEVVCRVPTLPIWRARLTMDDMAPLYEYPERLSDWPATRTIEEDERVSKSSVWSEEDIKRLGLGEHAPFEPFLSAPRQGSLPFFGSDEQDRAEGEHADEDVDRDDSPPAADFGF